MKLYDVIIIVIIILIIVLCIYIYTNRDRNQNTSQNKLQNIKEIRGENINKNVKFEKETYEEVQKLLINIIKTRFNYNYKLDKEEEKLLYPNFKAVADRIIDRALKFYDIYELKKLAYSSPFDFISSIPNLDSRFDRVVNGLQLSAIRYLIDKFPDIEPHIPIKYIKSYKNIFPIAIPTYKDNKIYFNKEQMQILNNFSKFLRNKKIV